MPHKTREIEEKQGLPMRDVLIKLYREKGTTRAMATELKVNQSTVIYWLMRQRLSIQNVLVDDRTGERVS